MATEVRNGENRGALGLYDEEHAERKPVENRSPKFSKDEWKTRRSFLDPRKRGAKFNQEFRPEAFPLTVVPRGRFEDIEFCLRPNVQTRHLPAGAKALLYAFNNLLPGSSFFGGSAMCRQALFEDGLLPLLQRHLVDGRRDVIPKRLHIVDLVFDRQRVEPRGRQWQGM